MVLSFYYPSRSRRVQCFSMMICSSGNNNCNRSTLFCLAVQSKSAAAVWLTGGRGPVELHTIPVLCFLMPMFVWIHWPWELQANSSPMMQREGAKQVLRLKHPCPSWRPPKKVPGNFVVSHRRKFLHHIFSRRPAAAAPLWAQDISSQPASSHTSLAAAAPGQRIVNL